MILLFKRRFGSIAVAPTPGPAPQPDKGGGAAYPPHGTGSRPTFGRRYVPPEQRRKLSPIERKAERVRRKAVSALAMAKEGATETPLHSEQYTLLSIALQKLAALNDNLEFYGRMLIIKELALKLQREIAERIEDEDLTLLIMMAS